MIKNISSLKECYINTNKTFTRYGIKVFLFFKEKLWTKQTHPKNLGRQWDRRW